MLLSSELDQRRARAPSTFVRSKGQRVAVETVIDVERDVCSSWFDKIKLSKHG